MKTTSLDREIRSRIDTLLTDISAMVKNAALESVHAALGGMAGGAPAAAIRRGPGRPAKAAGGKRGKRSSEDVQSMADALLAYIKKNEGQRLEQIAKGLGVPSKELKLPVQKLFAAKAIKTKGAKRGTTYFAR